MAKRSKLSNIFVWIIIGLLLVGLIGFGAVGLTGNTRSLGSVGNKHVPINDYVNALRQDVSQFEQQIGRQLTMPEIQQLGIDQRALSRVINERAFEHEAEELGLSMGDARVREEVLSYPAFQGLDGAFDRLAYADLLERNNTSENEFETGIRENLARDILQLSIAGGITPPSNYAEVLVNFISETRDFSWAKLEESLLITPTSAPSDADLVAYHAANEADFSQPDAKALTVAWISPDTFSEEIEVSDARVQELYDARRAEFVKPERRLVERLIFPSSEDAQAAYDAIQDGFLSFEQAVEDRGLSLSDVDLGDVTVAALGPAGDVVFGLPLPSVTEPVATDLGSALFRVVAILEAEETLLEDVRDQLASEWAASEAREAILDLIDPAEDLLASGGSLEELANEQGFAIQNVVWYPGVEAEINRYQAFQAAALEVSQESFPTILELDDGGIFAVRMDDVIPAQVLPLEAVREDVSAAWSANATVKRLKELAEGMLPQIEAGTPMAALGLTEVAEADVERTAFIEGSPPSMVISVFDMEAEEVELIEFDGAVYLLQLKAVHAADLDSEENQGLANILNSRLEGVLATEVLTQYGNSLRSELRMNINPATVNSVNSQIR